MEFQALYQMARAARDMAYAPHSRFLVGAVVVATDGRVFSGTNVENASFGLTLCAERVAIVRAIAEGAALLDRHFLQTIAVLGSGPGYATPCGACRQVMQEFANPTTTVVCFGDDGSYQQYSMGDMLPKPFGLSNLTP